ncbi:MAG: dihydroorotase [Gammaproteobacteria bacterium]|nr:MAG: dihydroorotase [Gammaproteobacteria bacterium]
MVGEVVIAQRYLISGGRFIDPANGVDRVTDLAIADGKVVAVGRVPRGFKTATEIDATGQWVLPGLVDLRARVRPSHAEENLVSVSELLAAVAGGVTTLVAAPEDGVLMDSSAAAHRLQQHSENLGLCRVIPQGALTRQLKGDQLSEMAALQRAGCQLMGNGRAPVGSQMMRNALDYAANFDLPVVVHCEVPGLAQGCIHEGATSLRLGLPGIPAAAEEAAVGRDLALARLTGAQLHFAGISTADAVQLLANAKKGGLPVTADVAIHHLLLCDEDITGFDVNYHTRPPLRGASDRTALCKAVRNSVIEVICSDHAPKSAATELLPFAESEPGIAGIESLLSLVLELVRNRRLPLERALSAVTASPAKLLQGSRGQLAEGAAADICIVDPGRAWQLQPASWQSRGCNSPFTGRNLRGRVTHTLIAGDLVYRLSGDRTQFPTINDSTVRT